ncbi:triosephosphate isomerase [Anaerosolibacter carboniphilus]|uniref:Triosephosphate isomerase n=1 Tax=Anaerosolibacter carboniphilus TaxID=1417629 RepID=A0A841L4N8_9FIRM|nr:triose-phosphate isomerase [Anaerosolibacter carboniphilus]MBB6217369.1 triosephosphate isomerase [Anaerosolibacter carboniphilus]
MRKKIIGASWKTHIHSMSEGKELAEGIKKRVGHLESVEIFILPTYPLIPAIADIFQDSNIKWGAQNISHADKGAFTGEVPPQILRELGCRYIEIGHAERRNFFHETDEMVAKKVKLILAHDMIPVVCIGESKEEKDEKLSDVKLKTQILWAMNGLDEEERKKVILAYEPIWAIGQEKAAKSDYVEDVHCFLRQVLQAEYGKESGDMIRIIYGGSVSPENATELAKKENIDGLFIGRFGLKAEGFEKITRAVLQYQR